MSKMIIYGNEAKEKVRLGVDAVANAVKSTLGPRGNTVLIHERGEVRVTKDGVSVAKAIELEDKLMNVGAQLVKNVASKTADDAGDGTTTATVLAQALITEGNKLIATGVNPSSLKKGIDFAAKEAVGYFKDHSVDATDLENLKRIATISANGDSEIGDLIGDVINQVGADGVVNVENSRTIETRIEKVKGLRYDRGYLNPHLITNPDKKESRLEDPFILITDQSITTIAQIAPVLELVAAKHKPIFIIADEISGEALTMLIVNHLRGTLQVCATKCPAFGDRKIQELQDIAAITGGMVISQEQDMSLEKIEESMLGHAQVIVSTPKHTTIVDGATDEERLEQRIADIKKSIEEESSEYNKNAFRERLAKLTDGVAILYVGAITEMELNEKRDRIDDALRATKAAFQEGTLPGGGIAYYNAARYLEGLNVAELTSDEKLGYDAFVKALKAPVAQIANNFGEGQDKVILNDIDKARDNNVSSGSRENYGFNARTGEYGDMRDMGVIDPTKVCRNVVDNAASIAGMYLSTNCVIVDEPEEKKEDK